MQDLGFSFPANAQHRRGTPLITDDRILTDILEREGGGKYTDNPADRGGPTRWGITLATLQAHLGSSVAVTAADVMNLSESTARAIYRARYIEEPGFMAISSPALRALLVDCAVLHGPRNAIKMLQRAIRTKDDGVFGPITVMVANSWGADRLVIKTTGERIKFLVRMATGNLTDADKDGVPDNLEFLMGWFNRAWSFVEGTLMSEKSE